MPSPDSSRSTNSQQVPSGSTRGIILFAMVIFISAMLGRLVYEPQLRANAANSDDMQDSVKQFTRVLSVVERNYADPVDTDKAIYDGAIPGMLHVLDPHSNFFDPKQYALFREEQEGKYYGVGMIVTSRENQTVVQAPFVNSLAYKAGIRPGDVILKLDGQPTPDDEALEKILDSAKGNFKLSVWDARTGRTRRITGALDPNHDADAEKSSG